MYLTSEIQARDPKRAELARIRKEASSALVALERLEKHTRSKS